MRENIYTYLLEIPEWKSYFDLWEEFWTKPSQEQDLATLHSNQNLHVYDC
jgi:hypothetical protein